MALAATMFAVTGEATTSAVLLGPTKITRSAGTPNQQTWVFPARPGTMTLTVNNLGVTSARIAVNNGEIFGPSDFKKTNTLLTRTLRANETNSLRIEVEGKPGTSLTVKLEQQLEADAATVIGPAGGILASADLRIEIPPGALLQSTVVSVGPSNNPPPASFSGAPIPGTTKELLPEGLQFTKPALVTWDMTPVLAQLPPGANVSIMHWGSRTMEVEGARQNGNIVTFDISHFSFLAASYDASEGWSAFKIRWEIPTIYWTLDTATLSQSQLGSFLTAQRIEQALLKWATKTTSFTFVYTPNIANANIIFEEKGNISTLSQLPCIVGWNTNFGFTCFDTIPFLPTTLKSTNTVKVRLASDGIRTYALNASFPASDYADSTILHEIGHALGLAHSWKTNEDVVMNEAMYTNWPPPVSLHKWDMDALDYNYELAPLSMTLTLSGTTMTINPFSSIIISGTVTNQTNQTQQNIYFQGWIQQGTKTIAAGGTLLVPQGWNGDTSVLGVVGPNTTFNLATPYHQVNSGFALANGMSPGSAKLLLELRRSNTVLTSKTINITLQ